MPTIIAYTDACVLYPAPIRDLLMECALNDLVQLKWSEKVLNEWIDNLVKNRPDLKRSRLENTAKAMNEAVLDALVEDYEAIEQQLTLPDADDRHVLAAAIKAKAHYIITCNLKDFPAQVVGEYKIKVCHPDEFFFLLAKTNLMPFLHTVKICQKKLRKPPKSIDDYILNLKDNCHLKQTSYYLEDNKELLK